MMLLKFLPQNLQEAYKNEHSCIAP